jgi:hypothetical protein
MRLQGRPRSSLLGSLILAVSATLCFFIVLAPAGAAAATPAVTVSPKTGTVGSMITVTGTGFPPNTQVYLGWTSQNATWDVKAIPTPQVIGLNSSPLVYKLGSTQSNASGSFSAKITVPSDYGGSHNVQAYAENGTAISPVAAFTLAPSFHVSSTSGPDGSPINIVASGLGTGIYSTSYQLYWDNNYVGYMTGVSTGGTANFTIYASGNAGLHYISVYEGGNGPGYLNVQQAPPSASYYDPPYIPFHANFTVTSENVVAPASSSSPGAAGARFTGKQSTALASFVLIAALAGGSLFVARTGPKERRAASRAAAAVIIVLLLVIAGMGAYILTMKSSPNSASTVTTTQSGSSASSASSASSSPSSSSGPTVTFSPVATSVRPQVTVSQNNATSGPRISVTPDLASVGDNITVTGMGFTAGAQLPLVWTTRQGSNLLGYKLVDKPLRNVTAGADGSFSFAMKVPSDLGGIHYIAAGNLTDHSNGTLFIQRTAKLSTTQGPDGTQIQVVMTGVGWDFNTNIAAVDYDNSYIGYGCGFNSGGNVTFTITASGAPGVHTIDVYPSVWWGPTNFVDQQPVVYRMPLLTPYDHPELMPSFHFTFLVTSG